MRMMDRLVPIKMAAQPLRVSVVTQRRTAPARLQSGWDRGRARLPVEMQRVQDGTMRTRTSTVSATAVREPALALTLQTPILTPCARPIF
jgi:hypothetical protein